MLHLILLLQYFIIIIKGLKSQYIFIIMKHYFMKNVGYGQRVYRYCAFLLRKVDKYEIHVKKYIGTLFHKECVQCLNSLWKHSMTVSIY